MPVYAIPLSESAKYVYVARDGRDVAWSFHHYLSQYTDETRDLIHRTFDETLAGKPMKFEIPDTPREFYHKWLDFDGAGFGPFFDNIKTWWEVRDEPNVLMVHFNDLKENFEAELRRIAQFLGVDPNGLDIPRICYQCSFKYMKENAERFPPFNGRILKDGARAFFNKGVNGRWTDVLEEDEVRKYEDMVSQSLTDECAAWLKGVK